MSFWFFFIDCQDTINFQYPILSLLKVRWAYNIGLARRLSTLLNINMANLVQILYVHLLG